MAYGTPAAAGGSTTPAADGSTGTAYGSKVWIDLTGRPIGYKPTTPYGFYGSPVRDSWYTGTGSTYGSPATDGNESLVGSDLDESIHTLDGNDIVSGSDGNDRINGGRGADIIKGNQGSDLLMGGAGDDIINGGKGNDEIHGDKGNDILYGDKGSDWLFGGDGGDVLIGGDGADIFRLSKGKDVILDFCPAEGDRIQLPNGTEFTKVIAQEAILRDSGEWNFATITIQTDNGSFTFPEICPDGNSLKDIDPLEYITYV